LRAKATNEKVVRRLHPLETVVPRLSSWTGDPNTAVAAIISNGYTKRIFLPDQHEQPLAGVISV